MSLRTGFRERALLLPCDDEQLLAVLTVPERQAASGLGVVIVVGGPQYRVGSHRQFVQLARSLATAGTPTLRFDVRGMGDSTGPQCNFEQISPDVGKAIDAILAALPGLQGVVLWGLCDGASAALLYLHDRPDPRVKGICLLNPWVRSAAGLARTHVKHYYHQRLRQREFWLKLFNGQVAGQALRGLWANLLAASNIHEPQNFTSYQTRMAAAWARFNGPSLLVLSGNDYTAKEFAEYTSAAGEWRGLAQRPSVTSFQAALADHTFSSSPERNAVEQATKEWLARAPRAPAT